MSSIAFVLGNGESRKGIDIDDLKEKGTVYACNAVYRTHQPHWLVAVDPKMMLEIAESDYCATVGDLKVKNIYLDDEIICPDQQDSDDLGNLNIYASNVRPEDLEDCD